MTVSPDDYTEHDQQIWDEELADFVPTRLFDAHIHLFDHRHHPDGVPGWSDADLSTLRNWATRLYPDREIHFLVLGSPLPGINVSAHNDWAIEQVRADPQSRINLLVTPACRTEDIRRLVAQPGVIGLKPYRVFSVTGDIARCRIHEFLPHDQLELANELGLWVTMHLSRFHGCADAENLADLRSPHGSRFCQSTYAESGRASFDAGVFSGFRLRTDKSLHGP